MREFFKRLQVQKKEPIMKTDEMLQYDQKKAELKAEILSLESHYKSLSSPMCDNLAFLMLCMSLNSTSNMIPEQHKRILDRKAEKEKELMILKTNKPEKIHFQIKL